MNTRLVIFDWDGTLMDSSDRIVNCFQRAARDVGVQSPAARAVRNIIGLGLREAMDELFPGVSEPTCAALVERYRDYFVAIDDTPMHLFPGVEDGLLRLHERGFMLGVATGKARRGLTRALAETGLAELFAVSRCADETRSKPHPQMLHDILDEARLSAEAALMVGDTVYDMQMARQAGVKGLAVTYGVHSRDRLLEQAPTACLDCFEEVTTWICAAR